MAAIPLFGRMKILHTLVGMGGAVLAAAVGDLNFLQGINWMVFENVFYSNQNDNCDFSVRKQKTCPAVQCCKVSLICQAEGLILNWVSVSISLRWAEVFFCLFFSIVNCMLCLAAFLEMILCCVSCVELILTLRVIVIWFLTTNWLHGKMCAYNWRCLMLFWGEGGEGEWCFLCCVWFCFHNCNMYVYIYTLVGINMYAYTLVGIL